MTRVLPRTNFHSSQLIRCLADLAIVETVDPGDAFARKLGDWIHFADAITLSAVHGDGMAGVRGAGSPAPCAAAGAECDRVQAALVNSITRSCSANPGNAHIKLPEPRLELPLDVAAAYAPYRRFYEAHQREMELSIPPLRSKVREAVAKASPRLRKLAELDAVLEKILRERERQLLAKVPALLRKRFEQLFNEHRRQLADTRQEDDPVRWTQAGGWLARFCGDMQMLLLAEVELRLQPAMGLIEACNDQTRQDTQ